MGRRVLGERTAGRRWPGQPASAARSPAGHERGQHAGPDPRPSPMTTASAEPTGRASARRRRRRPGWLRMRRGGGWDAIAHLSNTAIHRISLMYPSGYGVLEPSRPGVRAPGRPPAALAAADRTRRQRLPGPRAGDAGRRAAEPGLLPSAAAARRRAGHRHAQQLRRPRQLLPPGPGPLRAGAGRHRRRPAPGAAPRADATAPARCRRSAPRRRAVRVHRQQRPLTDRRGPAAPPRRRAGGGGQRRQPTQSPPAPQRRAGPARRSSASTSPASSPDTWTR